mgnify:CR=1 FL=1
MFCGNGGSAADAQHLATELVVKSKSPFENPTSSSAILNGRDILERSEVRCIVIGWNEPE